MTAVFQRTIALALLIAPLMFGNHASAQDNIRFARGAASAGVSGQVSETIKTWQFRAQKGQRITATLKPAGGDKGTLTMTIYAYCGEEFGRPVVDDVLKWEAQLPCNDRYTIDITPSDEAMKAKRVQRYTLTLNIR